MILPPPFNGVGKFTLVLLQIVQMDAYALFGICKHLEPKHKKTPAILSPEALAKGDTGVFVWL